MAKFKIGDKCKIVKYGHLVWQRKSDIPLNQNFPVVREDKDYRWIGIRPDYVGQEVIITGIGSNNESYSTTLFSWAGNNQLKLLKND